MWISKKEYERLAGTYNESVKRDVGNLKEIGAVRAKLAELGEALIAILPDELKPTPVPFSLHPHNGFNFQAILDAAEAVKRAEKRAEDKEILKIVKAMKGEA